MQLEIRYFASLVDRTGRAVDTVEVAPTDDVATLWRRLTERHPALAQLSYRPMVACDMVYADWDTTLEGVREVAFLPPVSGG